jgi:Tol biopolymer transport system component
MLRPLSSTDWRRLERLIDLVLDAPLDRRGALLAELSSGDAARREELERLVSECERGYPLIERTAAERFPAIFGDEAPPVPELLAGRYRILHEAGRGGMAIVYVARDLKHGRDVAVKVVRPELTATMGRARFLREIEIAARLHHPHIVPLYDSGELDASPAEGERDGVGPSLLYYVMPYEPGRSLRERLTSEGPLPVEDTVRILRDVCEALAHAHQHGIVHRDIKPDNVLLSGRNAMVTDFGVARAMSEASAEARLTAEGMAFGTRAYMAPEQTAADPEVDRRADIYAVGVLAYELLAGQPPQSPVSRRTAARESGLDAPPPLRSGGSDVPEALDALIAKALATRPEDRWQTADELLAALTAVSISLGAPVAGGGWRRTGAVTSVALGVVALVAFAFSDMRRHGERPSLVVGRARHVTSEKGLEIQPSISPDGRSVAYAAGESPRMHIDVRPVSGGRAIRLTSDTTDNQWFPRWSPDGARILFLSRGGAFSAPAFGGHAREEVPSRAGAIVTSAAWSPDGREIAYVRGDSLLARSVGSGRVRLITTGTDLHSCSWSPDGGRLACVSGNSFYITVGAMSGLGPMFGNLAPSKIVLISAAGGAPMNVTDSSSLHQSPTWSRDGKTLYYVSNRNGPRDVYGLAIHASGRIDGEPFRVTTGMGAQSIAFSADGRQMVYAAYTSSANVWTLPIPRHPPVSSASAVPVTSGDQTVEGVRVSADGRWVIYDSDLSGTSEIYRVPVTGGDPERLTHGPWDKFRGALSPGGKELAYHSFKTGSRSVFLMSLDGGAVQQLTPPSEGMSMANWSPAGNALSFFDMADSEVLVMRRDRHGRWSTPQFVGGIGWRPEWSPDGRTIAFVSPTDGRIGIVPADSGKQRDLYVPSAGDPLAELAIFAANGRELYFKSHDARGRASFWSIPVTGGRPRLLVRFDDPARASNRFEFASDGKRFYFTIEDRQSDVWVAETTMR